MDALRTQGTGVLVSDTMMFQRADPDPSDANLGSFYGLAMPLLMRGIPVEPVQIENATAPGFLSKYRLLFLTYEGQKPPTPQFHHALAQWVKNGGALVVVDDDHDPYNAVREWWNQVPFRYATPREHLFEALGLGKDAIGIHRVGRGVVLRETVSPAALTYRADGADLIRTLARRAARAVNLPWRESSALVLRRGPYVIAAGLDEPAPNAKPVTIKGRFLNLFDADLPIVHSVTVGPTARAFLYDLDARNGASPSVVAAACRITGEYGTSDRLRFRAEGIAGTRAVIRISASDPPAAILLDHKPLEKTQYEYQEGTIRMRFDNSVEGHSIELQLPSQRASIMRAGKGQ